MISMADAIAQMKLTEKVGEKPAFKSKRSALLASLYEYYERDYKKQMMSAYLSWLAVTKKKYPSQEHLDEFKKTKIYRPKISVKSFCSFWLSHIPTEDLYYLVSIAKDKENRKESFNKWLFWSLKTDAIP